MYILKIENSNYTRYFWLEIEIMVKIRFFGKNVNMIQN